MTTAVVGLASIRNIVALTRAFDLEVPNGSLRVNCREAEIDPSLASLVDMPEGWGLLSLSVADSSTYGKLPGDPRENNNISHDESGFCITHSSFSLHLTNF